MLLASKITSHDMYGAAVLAICDLTMADALDINAFANDYHLFLKKCQKACGIENSWLSFKKFITEYRLQPIILQQLLIPILMEVAEVKKNSSLDTELKAIGNYFKIDFIINRGNQQQSIRPYHGTISAAHFSKQDIEDLQQRNLIEIDKTRGQLILKKMSVEELNILLGEIPSHHKILEDWQSQSLSTKRAAFCMSLPFSDIKLLMQRGIIFQDIDTDDYYYAKDLTKNSLEKKLLASACKEKFIKYWKKTYTLRPIITLNNTKDNWYYLQQPEMKNIDLTSLDVVEKTAPIAIATESSNTVDDDEILSLSPSITTRSLSSHEGSIYSWVSEWADGDNFATLVSDDKIDPAPYDLNENSTFETFNNTIFQLDDIENKEQKPLLTNFFTNTNLQRLKRTEQSTDKLRPTNSSDVKEHSLKIPSPRS